MDIKIEAPGHKRQELLKDHYVKKLQKKYGNYDFVKSIDVKVKSIDSAEISVSLQLKPEKGKMLYVSGEAEKENIALNKAIYKMNLQIEKYKNKHYHNVHTVTKPSDIIKDDQ